MTGHDASSIVVTMHPLLRDPWVAARVEAAIAPYIGRLAESDLAWMRDQMAEVVASEPSVVKLVRRARPIDKSGEVKGDLLDEAISDARHARHARRVEQASAGTRARKR